VLWDDEGSRSPKRERGTIGRGRAWLGKKGKAGGSGKGFLKGRKMEQEQSSQGVRGVGKALQGEMKKLGRVAIQPGKRESSERRLRAEHDRDSN